MTGENKDFFVDMSKLGPDFGKLIGLSFGIFDTDHVLIRRLANEVHQTDDDSEEKLAIIDALGERHNLTTGNRIQLAGVFNKEIKEIQVVHELTKVIAFDGQFLQFLATDILVPLVDSKRRFAQQPLCFIVNGDLTSWEKIVPPEEQQCAGSDLACAMEAALMIRQDMSLRPGQSTYPSPTTQSESSG